MSAIRTGPWQVRLAHFSALLRPVVPFFFRLRLLLLKRDRLALRLLLRCHEPPLAPS